MMKHASTNLQNKWFSCLMSHSAISRFLWKQNPDRYNELESKISGSGTVCA